MIARYAGGLLGLFAFSMTIVVGLIAGHPAEVILSRALWALVICCVVGMAVGVAAQAVVNEFMQRKTAEVLPTETADDGEPEEVHEAETVPPGVAGR